MLLTYSMDISSEDDERTLTMVDPSYGADGDSSVHTAAVAPCVVAEAPQHTCHDDVTSHSFGIAGPSANTEALQQESTMPRQEENTKSAEKYQAEILKQLEVR